MKQKTKIIKSFDAATVITAVSSIIFICVQLIYPSRTSGVVRNALISSAINVIPSLFPFMVISRFIVTLGMMAPFEKLLGKSIGKLLGIPRGAIGSVIIGLTGGFPIGALTVCEAYGKGDLNKDEAEFALSVSHNTGPAFPIGVVGAILWNNKRFGAVVYFSQIISMIFLCMIAYRNKNYSCVPNTPLIKEKRNISVSSALTASVTSSASACVGIVGFIAFFKVIIDMILSFIPIKFELVRAIISVITEFSSGCVSAASIGGVRGAALSGFAIGFGGISALMQASALTAAEGLSIKKCLLFKSAQGALCALLCALYYICFIESGAAVTVSENFEVSIGNIPKYIAVLTVCMIALIKISHKKEKSVL